MLILASLIFRCQGTVCKYESANYDKVLVRLPKGEREEIKEAADAVGESLNAYIVSAIRGRMEAEK